MEPLIVGGSSEQAGVLYLIGVLFIVLAGLVLIIRTKGVLVLLILLGLVAVAVGSFSPGRRYDTEPIPISPAQQPQRCVCTDDAAGQGRHAASIFFSTSAGSAPSARTTAMNSTTSRRRSPVSIFDIKDCGTSSTSLNHYPNKKSKCSISIRLERSSRGGENVGKYSLSSL